MRNVNEDINLNVPEAGTDIISELSLVGEKDLHTRYYTQKQYFSRLQKHFIKKGKKATVEKLFRRSFLMPAKRKGLSWAVKMQEKFKQCEVNATYNIRLKTQKRGRRIKYRVTFLEKTRWLKKALLPLALTIKSRKTVRFMDAFQKEVDLLSEGRSEVKVKRDEYHKLALSKTPYSWRRSRKAKKGYKKKKAAMKLKVDSKEKEQKKYTRKFGEGRFYFTAGRWYYWKAPMVRYLKSKMPLSIKLAKLRADILFKNRI